MKTLIQHIAAACGAYKRCIASGNTEWEHKWRDILDELAKMLPSGSGIDCGTQIDEDASDDFLVVLGCQFHHMNENGYYDGWTEHTLRITAAFDGIHIRITGRNRNEIKEYLHDTYYYALHQEIGIDLSTADERTYAEHLVEQLHSAY